MALSIILLLAGFILLTKGGDILVEGSSSIAKHFNISELVIGLTIVSLGTSAPELLVNVIAAAGGASEIALGNVIGSNICNTLLILGVAGAIAPIVVKKDTVRKEIPFGVFISILLAILLNDALLYGADQSRLNRFDGIILLFFFILFMLYVYRLSTQQGETDGDAIVEMSTIKSTLFIIGGLAGLVLGGKFVVNSAVDIASSFGVSQALIGLTIVAVGTSLPELFASAMAARKGKSDIAIGNVIGSNIFNILFVLGVSSVVRDIPYPEYLNVDIGLVIASIFIVFALLILQKKHRIDRLQAITLVVMYILYTGYLIMRK